MKYQEVNGDLIKMALRGHFDVIGHGCNCQCKMGAGIAPQMAKAFRCDVFPKEDAAFKGDINKLGQIDYRKLHEEKESVGGNWVYYPDEEVFLTGKELVVVNMYTQFMYGKNHQDGVEKPLDYEALTLCLRKMNHIFKGKHIGLPKIGCGLAGGVWDINDLPTELDKIEFENRWGKKNCVKDIIQRELKDCNVTIVNYEKKRVKEWYDH